MKLKIIHGAPCSGKSTFVKKNMKETDIAYDYDALSRALQYSDVHKIDRQVTHEFVIDFRLAILNRVKEVKETKGTCWFIVTTLTQNLVDFTKDCDVEIIEMKATKEECLKRLEKDKTRQDKEKWKKKIEEWFENKQEKEGESMERNMKPNREYRSIVEIRANDKEDYIVEGYATTFNQPYLLYSDKDFKLYEQVDSKALDECDMSDVIFQYDHAGKVFARTRNKTLELSIDEKGLFIRADLGGTEDGRKLYDEIKGGYIDRMSFAFIVGEEAKEEVETNGEEGSTSTILRTIRKISKMYDVSAVSIPANDYTTISARNLFDGEIEKIRSERTQRAIDKLKLKMKLMEV